MADPYAARRRRTRMALLAGVRASVVTAVVLGALGFLFAFVLGNFSEKALGGSYAPDSPAAVGLLVAAPVLALGLLLSLVGAARARKDPTAPLKVGGHAMEVVRWSPALLEPAWDLTDDGLERDPSGAGAA